MSRIQARAAIFALLLVLPAAGAGCGGGGGSEDPSEVLRQTFDNPEGISSGQLAISFDRSAEDAEAGDLSVTLEGPFQSDDGSPTGFPQVDLTATISGSGANQSLDGFEARLIATENNAFVEYLGQAYEVGSTYFGRFKRLYAQSVRQGNQSDSSIFERLGIDPQAWLTNLSNEGDEDVAGSETVHIHGDADVDQIVSDLATIVERTPGGAGGPLDPAQLEQVKSGIQDATLDVYSGKEDQILRKLSLSLSIVPPVAAEGSAASSVDLALSVTFSEVNKPQTITRPSNAKPISGLLRLLELSGLGSLGSPGGTGGGTNGEGGGSSQAYQNCIDNNLSNPAKCLPKL